MPARLGVFEDDGHGVVDCDRGRAARATQASPLRPVAPLVNRQETMVTPEMSDAMSMSAVMVDG